MKMLDDEFVGQPDKDYMTRLRELEDKELQRLGENK